MQRPLIGQDGTSFEGEEAGAQRGVIGVLQEIARDQIELE